MRDYAMDVNQYTHGHGRFSATFGGYKPCHDAEQVIAAAAYDPEADLDNTPRLGLLRPRCRLPRQMV